MDYNQYDYAQNYNYGQNSYAQRSVANYNSGQNNQADYNSQYNSDVGHVGVRFYIPNFIELLYRHTQ